LESCVNRGVWFLSFPGTPQALGRSHVRIRGVRNPDTLLLPMKTPFVKSLLSVAAGCVCLMSLALQGAETNTVVEPKVSGHHLQVDLSKWDPNKTGHLEASELKAFQRDMHQQAVQRFEAQRRATAAARREQLARQGIPRLVPPAVLAQYDGNRNGILDPDEWAQYRADQALKHGMTYTPATAHGPDARIVTPPAKPIGK